MLMKPKYGWCSFKLRDFEGNVSYLCDPSFDLLDGFIELYRHPYKSVSIYFDCEEYDFTLVYSNDVWYILEEKDSCRLYRYDDISLEDITNELISDIECNLDSWSKWDYDSEMDEKDYPNRVRLKLLSKLCVLKELRDKRYVKIDCSGV